MPGNERLWTTATVVTLVRTVLSAVLAVLAAQHDDLALLVSALAVYWVGDTLDGAVARWLGCESRIGAVVDISCDRLNASFFYLGLAWLDPTLAWPIAIYLFQFMVIDLLLSFSFLAHPIRSPNYFYAVDETIWRWNWSPVGKAVNSGLFAVLLLTTGWAVAGAVIAVGLLGLKSASVHRLLRLDLVSPATQRDAETSAGDLS